MDKTQREVTGRSAPLQGKQPPHAAHLEHGYGLATRQAVVLMGTVQLLDSLLLEEAARKLARRETPEVRQGEEEEDLSSVA